jgi:excinuclease ABC subunit B
VAILDADKEGYLRSHRSLIQTAGRAARNLRGRVLFYGDVITDSMQQAITETARRRAIQAAFNDANDIVPMSIQKAVLRLDYAEAYAEPEQLTLVAEPSAEYAEVEDAVEQQIHRLELEMKAAAKELEFERAAVLRNRIRALRLQELEFKSGT